MLTNDAAEPLLRGGWNASESVAGFRRNHRLVCVGIPGWDPSEYAGYGNLAAIRVARVGAIGRTANSLSCPARYAGGLAAFFEIDVPSDHSA